MHALDEHVLGDDEALARRHIKGRRIIREAEGARPGERREIPRDQLEFTGRISAGHAYQPSRLGAGFARSSAR